MKNYLVLITSYLPAPRLREFTETSSSMATAVRRAIKKNQKEWKGRKIKEMGIKVVRL